MITPDPRDCATWSSFGAFNVPGRGTSTATIAGSAFRIAWLTRASSSFNSATFVSPGDPGPASGMIGSSTTNVFAAARQEIRAAAEKETMSAPRTLGRWCEQASHVQTSATDHALHPRGGDRGITQPRDDLRWREIGFLG